MVTYWPTRRKIRQKATKIVEKEVKAAKNFFQATGILVHIGDSRGQRICVSVRYVEKLKIEVAERVSKREREVFGMLVGLFNRKEPKKPIHLSHKPVAFFPDPCCPREKSIMR